MKKIICFIDDLCLGGAQRQLVGLSIMLKHKGYNVRFCTYHNDDFYKSLLIENGIDYEYNKGMEFVINRIPQFIKYIKRESPDVIISYIESPSIIAAIAKLFCRHVKLIVSERNTSQGNGVKEWLRFNLFRFADTVVPNSISQERYIQTNFKFLSPKLKTITNFVDVAKFLPDNNALIDSNSIVCVGRITPQKNILNYLHAIKRIKDSGIRVHFDWYGDTDNTKYMLQCIQLISKLGIEEYFKFHPAERNIVSIYQKAYAFCLPSSYEGFPNVICEAMSCGLPILCSNVCDNPDIVNDGENGFLFNPFEIEDIYNAILRISKLTEGEIEDIRQRNREKAINRFSMDNFIERYISIIE